MHTPSPLSAACGKRHVASALPQGVRACVLALLACLLTIPLPGQVVISEFMSSNENFLRDEDRDFSDWVEILNLSGALVNLDGWFLTDDPARLDRWQLPPRILRPGEHLVVFASNKDRSDPRAELHANFRLSRRSGYLALVQPDVETVSHAYAPAYPEQLGNIAYGLRFETTLFISAGAKVDVHVPTSDALGTRWTETDFTTATDWFTSRTGVGFNIADVQVAGELLVDIDAEGLAPGELERWTNPGSLGDFEAPRGRPVVETVGGVTAVTFDGVLDWMRSRQPAPVTVTGNSDWTIEVWAYNPERTFRETMVNWARGGGEEGHPASLGYGRSPVIGAVEHGDAGDMGYAGGAPPAGQWHHIVLTYTGGPNGVEALYVDGELNRRRNVFLRLSGIAAGDAFPVLLGTVTSRRDLTSLDGDFGGSIAQLRVHGGALSPEQILGNFLADAGHFAAPADPGAPRRSPFTGANVESRMRGVSPSAYARIGFDVEDPEGFDTLSLEMRYNDGFVAYLNGMAVARRNAPRVPAWNSAATEPHSGKAAITAEPINLTPHLGLLRPGKNVLAVHGMNISAEDADFRILPELTGAIVDQEHWMHLTRPTPGAANADLTTFTGPIVTAVEATPSQPLAGQQLVVTASVRPTSRPLTTATLTYRVMFGEEKILAMRDDGVGADQTAGDGTYTAVLGDAATTPGFMLRYYVRAADAGGFETRAPLFGDRLGMKQSPEYFGAMVADQPPTALPDFYWFVERPSDADNTNRVGARASVFYQGEFYDNVFNRIRGGTAAGWPKKHYKFEFNDGYHFRLLPNAPRVSETNLNAAYTDKSYVRHVLASETFRDAGTLYSETFHVRVLRNAHFFSVAFFIEQIDCDCLRRNELDARGALYKTIASQGVNPGLTAGVGQGFGKKNRHHESFSDLQELISGLAKSGPDLQAFLFDNVDLPSQITYMAANVVIQNIDRTVKNFYMYRDTEGTGEWQMMPWDIDLTFGPNALNTDTIVAMEDNGNRSSHPYMGGSAYPYSTSNLENRLLEVIFRLPATNQMFVRRLRTLMDQFLDPADPHYERRIDELVALLRRDVAIDQERWGGSAHFDTKQYTLEEANERIKLEYLVPRRTHLFVNHNIDNPDFPGNAGIPNAQPERPALAFGAIEYNPAGGNQDEEYVEIANLDATPIDVSGWTLSSLLGGVGHVFKAGTVIPTSRSIYVSPNVQAFRARASGPSGGQGLLVQGNYRGRLSNFGDALQLQKPDGTVLLDAGYEGDSAPRQAFLRMTELHYHPAGPTQGEMQEGIADADDFEFIELRNVGTTETIDLTGVRFVDGIAFDFATDGNLTLLAPGEAVLIVRNRPAFELRYGFRANIAGEYDGGLTNGGERVELIDGTNAVIHAFAYDDRNGWPRAADGGGPSLEVIDVDGDYTDPTNWRASAAPGGTPDPGPRDRKRVPAWLLY